MFKRFLKKSDSYSGKQKACSFDFVAISSYFQYRDHREEYSIISDQTFSDLGLDELFMFVDRTSSCVGQQYLYDMLRFIPAKANPIQENEAIIQELFEKEETRSALTDILSDLSAAEGYSIVSLLQQEPPVIPILRKYIFLVLRFLPTLFLLQFILFQSGVSLIALIASLIINMGVHYWNKRNSWGYLSSVPQLLKLLSAAKKISINPLFAAIGGQVPEALTSLKELRQNSSIFRPEPKSDSDFTVFLWLFKEYLHVFFLSEPFIYIRFVSLLKNKNKEIETVYTFVGLVDNLLSIAFLRKDLPCYCLPDTIVSTDKIQVEELYHPLIPACISNSFRAKDRSILLTGSNMSGKTTFIRTVGISILTAQVLHTAFARCFRIQSPIAIHSALMLADNLSEGKSFYLKEVEAINEMLAYSRLNKRNLFLLDEIFKGTNTTERIASAKAVLSYLNADNNLIFVSTHDTELATLLEKEYDLYHFCETIDNEELSFDYQLKRGKLTRRNAIRILEINNFPSNLIQDAYDTASKLENHIGL